MNNMQRVKPPIRQTFKYTAPASATSGIAPSMRRAGAENHQPANAMITPTKMERKSDCPAAAPAESASPAPTARETKATVPVANPIIMGFISIITVAAMLTDATASGPSRPTQNKSTMLCRF